MTDKESEECDAPPVLRDDQGRFIAGGRGGPGRPKGSGGLPTFATSVRLVAESQGVTIEEAVQAVTEAAMRKALDGDVAAQRLILERVPDSKESAHGAAGVEGGPWLVDVDGSGFPCLVGSDLSQGPQLPAELGKFLDELEAIEAANPVPHERGEPTAAERIHWAELERHRQITEVLS